MSEDIVIQLRDPHHSAYRMLRLQAAEIIERYRGDQVADADQIKRSLNQLQEAEEIICSLLGLELGSSERAMEWLNGRAGRPPAPAIGGSPPEIERLRSAVEAAHAAFEGISIGWPLEQNGKPIDHTLINEAKRLCTLSRTESK